MTSVLHKHRYLICAGLLAVGIFTAAVFARLRLIGMAVDTLLHKVGASEVTCSVSRASPWTIVLDDIGFLIKAQPFAAKRLTIARSHWWTPSLGAVRVEQARIPVKIGGTEPTASTTPAPNSSLAASQPVKIPVEEVSIDGQLVLQMAAAQEQALTVKFAAQQPDQGKWTAQMQVSAPGLGLNAEGTYDFPKQDLVFKIPSLSLDLKQWQPFIEQLYPMPGGPATIEGKITGEVEGRWSGKTLTAGGTMRLREGRYQNDSKAIVAEGVEADLAFIDFSELHTAPSALRIRSMRAGQLTMNDLDAELTIDGLEKIAVTSASLKALGGSLSVEPFTYSLNGNGLDVVLLAEGINVEDVMALTKDLPAKAKGRVSGRMPVQISGGGIQFGRGWLALTPGADAEIQLNAAGLLTSGVPTSNPSYTMLKKVESGLLKLKISELRLDIRPLAAPEGRSAQLHIQGHPADPGIKAPVILDLNVNGPLEKLLNMGMDSRLSFGSGK